MSLETIYNKLRKYLEEHKKYEPYNIFRLETPAGRRDLELFFGGLKYLAMHEFEDNDIRVFFGDQPASTAPGMIMHIDDIHVESGCFGVNDDYFTTISLLDENRIMGEIILDGNWDDGWRKDK